MGLLRDFFNQTRKPAGFLGKVMISGMNRSHAKMADWGMRHLPRIAAEQIADLGCGGGRNAGELLRRYPAAQLTAVDYSPLSVAKAREYNQKQIEEGRCRVIRGDVSELSLDPETFDLATAFETIYFWPGLERCFEQVARVLRPGGFFLIVNECDGMDAAGRHFEKIIDGMRCYTSEEIQADLMRAGFSKIKAIHHPSKPWIVLVAKK